MALRDMAGVSLTAAHSSATPRTHPFTAQAISVVSALFGEVPGDLGLDPSFEREP